MPTNYAHNTLDLDIGHLMKVIIIRNSSGESFFCPPENMPLSGASAFVDGVIKEIRETMEEGTQNRQFNHLVQTLKAAGFTQPQVKVCTEGL